MYKDGFYVPSLIPKEDVKAFERYPTPKRDFGESPSIVVIDMTHCFVDDKYPHGFGKTGIPCSKAIRQLLDVARPLKIPIFYTRRDRRSALIEIMVDPESRMSQIYREDDSYSNEIVEDLAPRNGEVIVEKVAPSAFFGTPFVALLNKRGVDTLIVTGMVTSGCVRATAVDAFSYGYKVVIPIECVADRSQISHNVSLFDLSMKYAHVMPFSEVIQNLSREIIRK